MVNKTYHHSLHSPNPSLSKMATLMAFSLQTPTFPAKTFRPISCSLSETSLSPATSVTLPVREIPGDYGLPLIGPLKDRLDYFYFQGRDDFFRSRVNKHRSTVYRTNMPPGPFISRDPKVIVLLDGSSFPILFDTESVEKKDLFTGTFMPSTDLTGGYRILSYLDPSELKHEKLKRFIFYLLQSRHEFIFPEFRRTFTGLFTELESELAAKGKADFSSLNDQASFKFLTRAFFGRDPNSGDSNIGSDGPGLITKWIFLQLAPLLTLGFPPLIEEPVLHTFQLPSFLVKSDYNRLYKFFFDSGSKALDEAEKMGISREEACHNLVFAICFNTYGGMKILFPSLMQWIGLAGPELHRDLATEIRATVAECNGVTFPAIEKMSLMKSVVYETLRIDPPVALQYGKAKRDLLVQSHDAAYRVRAGEMMFGYQPFATRDPRIFDRAEEFVADRFVGEGEELLKHVLWSNGPENESPTVKNKQCAGKDFVVLIARLLVVEFFLRYDSFVVEIGSSALGASVGITSLERASS